MKAPEYLDVELVPIWDEDLGVVRASGDDRGRDRLEVRGEGAEGGGELLEPLG